MPCKKYNISPLIFFLSLFLYIIQAAIYNELFCVIVIQVFVTWATVAAIAAAHTLSSSLLTLHNGGLLFRTDRCRKLGLCIVILKYQKWDAYHINSPIPIITFPENILENSVKKVPKLFFGTVTPQQILNWKEWLNENFY